MRVLRYWIPYALAFILITYALCVGIAFSMRNHHQNSQFGWEIALYIFVRPLNLLHPHQSFPLPQLPPISPFHFIPVTPVADMETGQFISTLYALATWTLTHRISELLHVRASPRICVPVMLLWCGAACFATWIPLLCGGVIWWWLGGAMVSHFHQFSSVGRWSGLWWKGMGSSE